MTTLTAEQKRTYTKFADLALPRHTSYPAVPAWRDHFSWSDLVSQVNLDHTSASLLGLYVHVPYCRQLCHYCGCTRDIVPDGERVKSDPAEAFLAGIALESSLLKDLLGKRPISKIHLGGGTPTFLTPLQLRRLMSILGEAFAIAESSGLSVEVDPRVTTTTHLKVLRELGFNRVSLGVQEFNPRIQEAVNRVQPFEQVSQIVDQMRHLGFKSINFDLIYGLPFQTEESLSTTLAQVLKLTPDRIAFFRLAMIPEMFRWQRSFAKADLPTGERSLALMLLALNTFTAAGYEFIGLDHFAKPQDALATAIGARKLWRSFQGVTDERDVATIGIGPSAISQLPNGFGQNLRDTKSWLESLKRGQLPLSRGMILSPEDRLRQDILQELYNYGAVDLAAVGERHGVHWQTHFAHELACLLDLANQGIVTIQESQISATWPLGRLLLRVIAAIFDTYLPPKAYLFGVASGAASKTG